mmetsp:Transcript_9108/g.15638  ORF Transcript_9108/g.15638 Transcript_9108/m.15638 type:complete len:88 (+) Transcript_9108:4972-5235(+)
MRGVLREVLEAVSTQTPVMRAVQAMRAVQEVQVVPAAVLAALMAVEGLVELVELVAAGSEKRLYSMTTVTNFVKEPELEEPSQVGWL